MSDLIKSITTDITTISINDVLEEAFEAAVETTPSNNDLILSYNPVSQTLGKSTFPALERQVLAVDLRALKIDKAINTVPYFETSTAIVFTVDLTGAADLNVISLSIGQHHTVTIAGAEPLQGNNKELLDGTRNEYFIIIKGGKLYYLRTYTAVDAISPVVIGDAAVIIGRLTKKSIQLYYDADNAIMFKVKRTQSADYSNLVEIYSGTNKELIDDNLAGNTDFYYEITGFSGLAFGQSERISAKTKEDLPPVTVMDTTFDYLSDLFASYNGADGVNTVDGGADGRQLEFSQRDYAFLSRDNAPFNTGDALRITITGFNETTDNVGLHVFVNDLEVEIIRNADTVNGVIVIDVPEVPAPVNRPNQFLIFYAQQAHVYLRSIKVEVV